MNGRSETNQTAPYTPNPLSEAFKSPPIDGAAPCARLPKAGAWALMRRGVTGSRDAGDRSWLDRALTYYIWSIMWSVVLSTIFLAICCVVDPVAPSGSVMDWLGCVTFAWALHPVLIACLYAKAVTGVDVSSQTSACLHAFWMFEGGVLGCYLCLLVYVILSRTLLRTATVAALFVLTLMWFAEARLVTAPCMDGPAFGPPSVIEYSGG